jgi:transcriptional regulator with XRE-family HTH domain
MQTHPLTTARIARGWSQARLAEQVGVSIKTVVRWELGQNIPYRIHRERLCHLFGQSSEELGLLPLPAAPKVCDPFIPENLVQVNHLLGRDDLLHKVKQYLLAGKSQTIVALQGLPGVGKTALAAAIAMDEQVQAHFPDGVLWAGLGPQADFAGLLTRWCSLLAPQHPQTDQNPVYTPRPSGRSSENAAGGHEKNLSHSLTWSTLRTYIGQRRMLLVIEDAWEAEAALAVQVGGPQCAYLLTTRSPQVAFAIAHEATISVPELNETDGLSLLARFVPQVVTQEEEIARKLVRMVGGLPLALNLLGRYLATQVQTGQPRRMCTAFSKLLERRQHLQISMPTPLSERPLGLALQPSFSLQATITLSIKHLSQEEQNVLSALALFPPKPRSFSEAAALAISGGSVEQLDALWDAGLLESSGPGRYTLHPTIADYACNQHTNQMAWQRLMETQTYTDTILEQELTHIKTSLKETITYDSGTGNSSERCQKIS